jgi:hypothetical protein
MLALLVPILLVPAAGCSDGNDDALDEELAAVTAERDELAAQIAIQEARHDKAEATQEAVVDIIADPASFGTEEEVLDLLDQYAVSPDIVYGDEALGDTTWRAGWRNTLFGSVDADIQTWTRWLSDDGSTGGSLWSWNGTAANGEPFTLSGIELEEYDDDGLFEALRVYYPMPGEDVVDAFDHGNATVSSSEPPQKPTGVFSFADDDLCEWLSPATIAALVAAEYEWNGTASEGGFTDLPDGCAWELSGTPDVEGLNTVLIGSAPAPQEPFLDYDDLENTTSKLGVGVRGHPALSDGVIYSYGGFGYAAFGVPERGYIQVYLWVPGDEGTEDARFAFADAVIRELGWMP